MRAERKTNLRPFFQSGQLTERESVEAERPQRGSHLVSVLANCEARDRLDSWKEIASHLKRTVRTVQRWEKHEGLPVHRHLHRRANSVYAHRSELDDWWNREADAINVEPLQVPSEGSPRAVTSSPILTATHSEGECRDADLTSPQWLVECVLELPERDICCPDDGAGLLVSVLQVRIFIPAYLRRSAAESVTKGAKVSCRALSLALARCAPLRWRTHRQILITVDGRGS